MAHPEQQPPPAVSSRFEELLEAAPDGIMQVDESGRIILLNRVMEKMFGYTRDELIGLQVEILVPDNVRLRHPELRASFHRAPSTRAMGAKSELHGQRKDGSLLPVDIGLSPLPGRNGANIQVAVSIRDVTERVMREVARDPEANLTYGRQVLAGLDDGLRPAEAHYLVMLRPDLDSDRSPAAPLVESQKR